MKRYAWYVPGLYVAGAFGIKIYEGFFNNTEIVTTLGAIPQLKTVAVQLAPFVGTLDFLVAIAFLFNPLVTKNPTIQKLLFLWVSVWPFIPASLRYFGGVGDFEVFEVLSISAAAIISYVLWTRYANPKVTTIESEKTHPA